MTTEATTGASAPNQTPFQDKEYALAKFGLDPDKIIRKDGRYWMTAEQLGIALGYRKPRQSVINLLNRHRKELRPFISVTNLETQINDRNYGAKETTIFNTGGQFRVALFANTPKAEKFRTFVVNMLEALEQEELVHISQVERWRQDLLELFNYLGNSKVMDWKKYNKMLSYREMGLNQEEIAKLLDVSARTIRRLERVAMQSNLQLVKGGASC